MPEIGLASVCQDFLSLCIARVARRKLACRIRYKRPDLLDLQKITRALKKTFKCNGSVTVDPELGEIIQLSGDQRTNVRAFFVDQEVCHEDQIVIHGG